VSRITAAALAATLGTVLGLALLTGVTPAAASPAARSAGGVASGIPTPQLIGPGVSLQDCPNGEEQVPQPTSSTVRQTPWAENALDFEQAWPFTVGAGITVAVVDSGVNWTPQLQGRVRSIDLTGTGLEDCVGHGTGVAGIIAASDDRSAGNQFAGVAPQANILSVKVTNSEEFPPNGDITLANGIHDAASLGAKVISVSVQGPNIQALAQAVAFAQSKGAVVVAAGGNDDQEFAGTVIRGPFYPASYPGVLSVGGLEPDGSLNPLSDLNSNVQVTAPGSDITSLTAQGYFDQYNGTSFATPFVSGVAALVRSYSRSLTQAQVVGRIVATADGNAGVGTGAGMVNPLQAVTDLLPRASTNGPVSSRVQRVPVSRPLPPDTGTRNAAMMVTVSGVGGAALLVLASLVIIQGRRRRWRPGRAPDPEAASAAASGPGLAPIQAADPSDVLGGGRW
jgi:membrane-anchored mycosin MYCP